MGSLVARRSFLPYICRISGMFESGIPIATWVFRVFRLQGLGFSVLGIRIPITTCGSVQGLESGITIATCEGVHFGYLGVGDEGSEFRFSGRGAARAEDAQGTPTHSHISPSILVYED